MFPCVSLYRWIHFPSSVLISFVNLTSSCSLIRQKKNVFFHMHEITSWVVVLYTSLLFVDSVYKPQRACQCWLSQCDRIMSLSMYGNQTYLFGWISPRPPYNVRKNARHHFIVRLGNFKHYQFISFFFALFSMKMLGKWNYFTQTVQI